MADDIPEGWEGLAFDDPKVKKAYLNYARRMVEYFKPTVFGIRDDTYFFGLPGNPVSTFVLFEVLVRPFLMKMMGNDYAPLTARVKLVQTIKRKKTDRQEFRPVRLDEDGNAAGFDYHGSAHIHAYTRADGVVVMPQGVDKLEQGSEVEVLLIK